MDGSLRYDLTAALAEFLGTAYFLFMAGGGTTSIADYSISGIAVPFAFGWSLFVNIWIWSPISGGILNPAITIALTVTKNISPIRGVLYIIAEMLGALFGSYMIYVLLPDSASCATVVASNVSTAQAFFLELFATSVLTSAVFFLAVEKAGGFTAPFGVGMALFISAIAIGPFTGASLNPARTFGPSIVYNQYGTGYWVYYVGTILGGLLAAGYWKLFKILDYKK
ncbi:13576_t:CDS:2, partial [Acaulospora morrowiae]